MTEEQVRPRSSSRCILTCVLALVSAACHAFGFEDVAMRAQRLAQSAYQKPEDKLPGEIGNLSYDQFRDIRYRSEKAYWRDARLPFELTFFHLGMQFRQPVRINEIAGEGAREIKFDPALFDYGHNKLAPNVLAAVPAYAGFRVHFPVNTPTYRDEVLTFLGASYFRALGQHQRYGASARGLAIDTGLASGEEFPSFVEFWVQRPTAKARTLVIYALLDSRRATGAYGFVLTPGVSTVVDVRVRLFLREPVGLLGIAPLSSMFFFGENERAPNDDFRPEVHDSDGLSIHDGTGEWIWRPLSNPKRLLISSFKVSDPQGFGLMQRDRKFDHYEDLEARYEERPGVWIEPRGKWGPGQVELVEIPTPNEANDNVVAFWRPDTPPAAKTPYELAYRLWWEREQETTPPRSRVVQTRWGNGYEAKPDKDIGFVIDFEGPALRQLRPTTVVEAVTTTDANAKITGQYTQSNPVTGGWRVRLKLHRVDDAKPVEMRTFLRSEGSAVSETWSYLLPPG